MLSNDMAKFIDSFDLEEKVEVISRTIRILENLKINDLLSGGLLKAFEDLFKVDKNTGIAEIEKLSIDSLCQVCRFN